MITGRVIRPGDVLIGAASSGVHSNGFSLVRKIFDVDEENLKRFVPGTRRHAGRYAARPDEDLCEDDASIKDAGVKVKGCSHITGGGFYENIPRMLPDGACASIRKDSYPVPPIFRLMQKTGDLEEHMMYNTFNMGIGMCMAVDPSDADKALAAIEASGEKGYM
jgi:phosphoribosylformylglycinamidine cyclo-ligase